MERSTTTDRRIKAAAAASFLHCTLLFVPDTYDQQSPRRRCCNKRSPSITGSHSVPGWSLSRIRSLIEANGTLTRTRLRRRLREVLVGACCCKRYVLRQRSANLGSIPLASSPRHIDFVVGSARHACAVASGLQLCL